MQTPLLKQFVAQLTDYNEINEIWSHVSPYFFDGKAESRAHAYVLFSKILKITQITQKHENMRELWLKMLREGCFSLIEDGRTKQTYNFFYNP